MSRLPQPPLPIPEQRQPKDAAEVDRLCAEMGGVEAYQRHGAAAPDSDEKVRDTPQVAPRTDYHRCYHRCGPLGYPCRQMVKPGYDKCWLHQLSNPNRCEDIKRTYGSYERCPNMALPHPKDQRFCRVHRERQEMIANSQQCRHVYGPRAAHSGGRCSNLTKSPLGLCHQHNRARKHWLKPEAK